MPVHNLDVSKLSQSTVVENLFVVLHACALHLSIVCCHRMPLSSGASSTAWSTTTTDIMFQPPHDRQMYSPMTQTNNPRTDKLKVSLPLRQTHHYISTAQERWMVSLPLRQTHHYISTAQERQMVSIPPAADTSLHFNCPGEMVSIPPATDTSSHFNCPGETLPPVTDTSLHFNCLHLKSRCGCHD